MLGCDSVEPEDRYPSPVAQHEETGRALYRRMLRGYMLDGLSTGMGGPPMAKMYEGDREFGWAGQYSKAYRTIAAELRAERLKAIARAYAQNMERVTSLCSLPIDLIAWVNRQTRIVTTARINLGMSPLIGGGPNIITPELQSEIDRLEASILAENPSSTPEERANESWSRATILLKELIKVDLERDDPDPLTNLYFTRGADAILVAMVTSAYAAFETLAADLWVVALDAYPALAVSWSKQNEKKSITLEDLAQHGFDLSSRMGTTLVLSKKASFQTLKELREHYSHAFGAGVDACFSPDVDLIETERLRHHLAHRGGLIDQRFKSQMRDYPRYADQPIGAHVVLYGPAVCDHIEACVTRGVGLLRYVDEWVTSHK